MLKKLLNTIVDQKASERKTQLYNKLLRHEAKIGGAIFGNIPQNHRREFFCLDEHTWVWHEEWLDSNKQRHVSTTRYDVRPHSILKSKNGSNYTRVSPKEALKLYKAAQEYKQRVAREIYHTVA